MNATDLSSTFDELGKRLGPAGQHVFELAVRQVYVDAATAAIAFITVVVVGVASGPRIYR